MACSLNGTNQYLTVNADTGLQFGTGDFAVSMWAKATEFDNTYNTLISIGRYDDGVLLRRQGLGGANDSLYIAGSYYNWASYNLSTSSWNHIVVSRVSSSVNVYVNASSWLSATNSNSTSPNTNTNIGTSTHSLASVWKGQLAEVAIWNGVGLGSDDVLALKNGFRPLRVKPSGLAFYAPLIRGFVDVRGGRSITNTGSATVADHPRVY